MAFNDDMAADLGIFFCTDEFAQAGVYNDGAQDSDITVLIEADSDGAGNFGVEAIAYVSKAYVPAPDYRHTITVSGVTWTIDQKKHGVGYKDDGLIWQLPLIREQRSSQWRR